MKTIGLSLLFFLFAVTSNSSTDPKTINSLNQINGHYYCLIREGLRDFQCQIKSSLFETYKSVCLTKYGQKDKRSRSVEKVELLLAYPGKDGFSIEEINYKPSGNKEFDDKTSEVFKHVEIILNENLFPWALFTLEPIFGENDLKRNDIRIQKKDGKLSVILISDRPVTDIFDQEFRTCDMEAGKTAMIKSSKLKFITDPKGLILSESEADLPNGAIMSFRMESQSIKGFLMPKRLLVQIKNIGKSHQQNADSAFVFTDYQINQSRDKKK
jgi:hypothetical protein